MSHSTPLDVLVVEDERPILRAAGRVLVSAGLTASEAGSVPEAVNRLRSASHRLVLADIMLPGESGFDLIAWIRERCPQTPVVAITGYATVANALHSFSLGAFDFLPKPFDEGELLAVVRRGLRALGLSAREPETEGPPRHLLGAHAWAAVQEDRSVTIGIGQTLYRLLGEIERIELPAVGDTLHQGRRCLRIHAADGLVHRVWAPLGGRVIAVNRALDDNPMLLTADPFGAGWPIRIRPENLNQELTALISVPGVGSAPLGAGRR